MSIVFFLAAFVGITLAVNRVAWWFRDREAAALFSEFRATHPNQGSRR